ncbi:uncharacterized protein DS421_1g02200 [Arachis hypogaea]|nr:uncharacterized protein DS421_1g02200 [Arachis hypogaea]
MQCGGYSGHRHVTHTTLGSPSSSSSSRLLVVACSPVVASFPVIAPWPVVASSLSEVSLSAFSASQSHTCITGRHRPLFEGGWLWRYSASQRLHLWQLSDYNIRGALASGDTHVPPAIGACMDLPFFVHCSTPRHDKHSWFVWTLYEDPALQVDRVKRQFNGEQPVPEAPVNVDRGPQDLYSAMLQLEAYIGVLGLPSKGRSSPSPEHPRLSSACHGRYGGGLSTRQEREGYQKARTIPTARRDRVMPQKERLDVKSEEEVEFDGHEEHGDIPAGGDNSPALAPPPPPPPAPAPDHPSGSGSHAHHDVWDTFPPGWHDVEESNSYYEEQMVEEIEFQDAF